MSSIRRGGFIALAAFIVAASAIAMVPALRWRAEVVLLKARGDLPELPLAELVPMVLPGSPVYLETLAETGNPFASIHNPLAGPADVTVGRERFRALCATCHGDAGGGGTGPALTGRRLRRGDSDWAMFRTIRDGIAGTAMPAWDLDTASTWQLVAFVRTLDLGGGVAAVDAMAPALPVTPERLAAAEVAEPGNWLSYAGGYRGHRRSALAQITRANVGSLALQWVRPTQAASTLEVTPLAHAGLLFISVPPQRLVAIDARSGREAWSAEWKLPSRGAVCCDSVNRGAAILGDRVYVGTLDARLLAFDAASGAPAWEARLGDGAPGYGVSGAPLAVADMIMIGSAGSVHGVRGFIEAYDAATGARRWRFDTVPGPGAPGHETWGGESWRRGGAMPWTTGTYDVARGLLYWGIGNPAPVFDGGARPGDNLYSSSVVALDAQTGALRWHFQFTPHDTHDLDAAQTPVLVDGEFQGRSRALLAFANRNGFYYLLDRESGEFLLARPFARQTWAERIDEHGRPVGRADAEPTPQGTLVWPSSAGATSWWPPAFDAGLLYVPTMEFPSIYFSGSDSTDAQLHLGGSTATVPGIRREMALNAIRYDTGEIAWRRPLGSRLGNGTVGGVLATAGGLVFVGDDDTFYALDSENGEVLWHVRLGAHIKAPPVTYDVDGRQQLAIAAGTTVFAFALPAGVQTR